MEFPAAPWPVRVTVSRPDDKPRLEDALSTLDLKPAGSCQYEMLALERLMKGSGARVQR